MLPTSYNLRRCLVGACLAFAAAGCGPSTGTVKGKVLIDGAPLTSGSVSLQSSTGLVCDAPIKPDGTYEISNVPVGSAKILVSAMDPKFEEKMNEMVGRGKAAPEGSATGRGKLQVGGPANAPAGGDFNAQYTLVDLKYGNWATSGLNVNVAGASTNYDVVVTKPAGKK